MNFGGDEGSAGVEVRRLDGDDLGFGSEICWRDVGPGGGVVLGEMNEAVAGTSAAEATSTMRGLRHD